MFNPLEHLKENEVTWYAALNDEDRKLADALIYLGTLNRREVKKLSKTTAKLITKRGLNV